MDLFKLEELGIGPLMAPTIALVIGLIIVIILSFIICKKHGISKLSTLIFILLGYGGGIYCAKLMGGLYTMVSQMYGGGKSNVAIFGVVVGLPLVLIAASLISGKDWKKVNDLFAPGAFLGLAFSKFGCFFAHCCPGIECSFGTYNPLYEKVMFPSQLCESVTMVFVVAFSFWYSLKYKKRISGAAYPVTAMLYTFTRFCWEFLRYYDLDKMKHLLFGLSFWQLWCVAVFAASCVWLLILKNPKLTVYEEKYYTFINARLDALKGKLKSKLPSKTKTAEDTVSE